MKKKVKTPEQQKQGQIARPPVIQLSLFENGTEEIIGDNTFSRLAQKEERKKEDDDTT